MDGNFNYSKTRSLLTIKSRCYSDPNSGSFDLANIILTRLYLPR